MEIELARELGFCFGVRRAVRLLERAAQKPGKIQTLGPVVHNQRVVEALAERGITVIDSLDQFRGDVLVITIHGVSPEVLMEIQARHLSLIDTTCPIVRRAQRIAKKLSEAGFWVIIFGESTHPEVRGLLGWASNKAIATLEAQEVSLVNPLPRRFGIISQTTQSQSNFNNFVQEVIRLALPRVQELRITNTLCDVTQCRQEAALELANRSELMIVVGGHNSANTRHLAEVCSAVVETHLVESAMEIKATWLQGKNRIGITAGASTPDWAIDEVILKLKSLSPASRLTSDHR